MRVEEIKPYSDSNAAKGEQIEHAFDSIAPAYDRLNRILSLGIDLSWRKRSLKQLRVIHPQKILDVATGTGDFALLASRYYPSAKITGMDLSEGMMEVGREKVNAAGLADRISFQRGDALAPPFQPGQFDAITAAFGVRNFENILAGFQALGKLLRPRGRFLILELSRPEHFPMKQLHGFYVRHWLPHVGKGLTGHSAEYAYLANSVADVPQGEKMLDILRKAGFVHVSAKSYTFGICTCYLAEAPGNVAGYS